MPSDLHRIGPGEACYTVLLNESGGIRDDLIVYDCGAVDAERGALVLVINAACADADTAWIRERMEPAGLTVTDIKDGGVLLALQGPEAMGLLEELSGEDLSGLPRFGHRSLNLQGITHPVFTARTGYTGEDGAELLLSADDGQKLWQILLDRGVCPCGLGARDTLRLEAAMHLYGMDMNADTTPFEAGLGWLVHLQRLLWQRWDTMLKLFAFRIALEERTQLLLKAELTQLKTIKMMVIVFTGCFMILLKVVTIVQGKPMFTG